MLDRSEPRDQAVTFYVRMRLRELLERKEMDQVQIARAIGRSTSYVSQVLTRIGVGGRSIDGFARLLQCGNADNLRRIAYQWWLGQGGNAGVSRIEEPAVQEAVALVRNVRPKTTDAQFKTILTAFGHHRFDGRDSMWWYDTLLAELALEKRLEIEADEANTLAKREASKVARRMRDKQGEFRTGHQLRSALAAEEAEARAAVKADEEAARKTDPERPSARPRRKSS
jgi:transcriptional regulator with XRE-family HTH domain